MPHTHAGTVPPDLVLGTPLFCPAPASGWVQDGKGFDWTLVPGDPERIRATAGRIRAAL
ncbi:MAG: hypothetical protein HY766_12240 [candidate division NC10 bacterium]|nr:hypothetical protein [candidate division NC10 bacterium]MBI4840402.1 hypothetical protein [candidate division NC10 bacterium]